MMNSRGQHKPTKLIKLGRIKIGGGAPVSVQTMTNTDTRDISGTVSAIKRVMEAGCDIVRLAIPDADAAEALKSIRKQTEGVPLVADIHFDWRLALASLNAGIDGLRINPGNIGESDKVKTLADAAKKRGIPIRIGVNGGSLEKHLLEKYGGATPEALVESALNHVKMLEDANFHDIKISVKSSSVEKTISAYRLLSKQTDYPLHLGVTEAGTLLTGAVRSSVAMGILLSEGIGDTIRVSLTDDPIHEVAAGLEILRSLAMREPGPSITSCPTCGRTRVDVISTAKLVENALGELYRKEPGTPKCHVAVMGCVVNGPGEAKDADIALVGGIDGFYLYIKGQKQSFHSAEESVGVLIENVRNFRE